MTEVIEVEAEVIEPTDELNVTYKQAIIKDNLAAIEAYIDKQLEPYIGATLDPNDEKAIKQFRTFMADLNKLKEPIEAERKRIKSEYEAPLKTFEGKVKAITGKIDSTRGDMKKQVDAADESFKTNRRCLLEEEFAGCTGVLDGLLRFEGILDTSWLNRSTPESRALKGLQEAVISAIGKYETLVASGLRHKDECVKLFCETLDLQKALALDGELVEKERAAAEFAAKRAAVEATVTSAAAPTDPAPRAPQKEAVPPTKELLHHWMLHIEFDGFTRDAIALRDALKALGLTGGTIKDMGVVGNG